MSNNSDNLKDQSKSRTQFKGIFILLLTAFIWGTSFVSQSLGMESVDAFTFMAIRTLLGATFLLPFILIRDKISAKNMTSSELLQRKQSNKKTIKNGMILGIVLCAATNFQQFAFYYSTAGKIAFITAMYMFFVPIVGLFLRRKIPLVTWICIFLGFIGLYFLSFKTGSGFGALNKGDILAFICSLFFCIQILLIDKFVVECDGIKLSCVQFYTSGIISLILMLIFEKPEWTSIKAAALPILYSGILSCGVAYTLQIVGQKYCEPTIASLLMCMESVFAVLSAAIVIHEVLTGREIFGCVIMFFAIVLSQIADIMRAKKLL